MEGWIKIHRKMLDWGWFKDSNTFHVFLYLLLKANFKPCEFLGKQINRGECATSVANIANATGLSYQNVRSALKHLESTNEVTSRGYSKFSVFTITNFERYQDANEETNEQVTSNQRTSNEQLTSIQRATNEQVTTIEERKNNKKERKEEGKKERTYIQGDTALDEAFRDYAEMRKRIRKPLTDKGVDLAIAKLRGLASESGVMDNDKAIKILEQSTFNSWQGLFPLKTETRTVADIWENA